MTNTVDVMRAKTLFDVIKEPCGMDTILSTEDLCRDFKIGDGSVVNALKNINIEIEKGKLTILRGRSGSGKTTLINILGALDKPTKGKVMFGGRDITRLSERARDDIRRYKMAFVFQSVALMSGMTAYENVDFGLRLAKYPYEERDKRTRECLRSVGLEKRMFHRPGEMSGGEQQRVGLARALVNNPSMIIADEPTGNIDPALSYEIVNLLRAINERGTTILMVTHEHRLVKHFHRRVIEIHDGTIVADTAAMKGVQE